jgi:hypothetical protein
MSRSARSSRPAASPTRRVLGFRRRAATAEPAIPLSMRLAARVLSPDETDPRRARPAAGRVLHPSPRHSPARGAGSAAEPASLRVPGRSQRARLRVALSRHRDRPSRRFTGRPPRRRISARARGPLSKVWTIRSAMRDAPERGSTSDVEQRGITSSEVRYALSSDDSLTDRSSHGGRRDGSGSSGVAAAGLNGWRRVPSGVRSGAKGTRAESPHARGRLQVEGDRRLRK